MTSEQVIKVSDATSFKAEVLDVTSEPVVVDFFAEWCGPCKAMAPKLDEVAKEMAGKVKIVKIDVDQNPEITDQYKIQAMPTLIIFKNGEEATRHTGALVQKTRLKDWINQAI
ncbi:MAG: thioredoxin [Pseudomonadota bacterium]